MQAGNPIRRAQVFPILILVLTLLTVPVLIFGSDGLGRVDRLEAELVQIRRENGKLEAQCRELRRRLEAYRTRPGYLEDVARDELGLVRPDEMVLVFPDDRPAP
ncbi:MAG: septum formation initiator family protein [Deltaproteobacteria bacterium]|nr:septum formation initiator family protein [Deltaproteobacteria bacterium]